MKKKIRALFYTHPLVTLSLKQKEEVEIQILKLVETSFNAARKDWANESYNCYAHKTFEEYLNK